MAKNKAELKEALSAIKEELKVAKSEKRDLEKASKLEKDTDHSENPKVGKKWTRLNEMVTKKQKALDAAQASYDGASKEPTIRKTVYEYPKDVITAVDKKKYRTAARAAAKKAAKGEAAPKKADKVEVAETTTSVKKKKGNKNKAAEPEDTED